MNPVPSELIPLLVPLIALELGLAVWALWDLTRPGRRVRGESRLLWGVIILFVSLVGPILYFVAGRQEAGAPEPEPRRPWVGYDEPGAVATTRVTDGSPPETRAGLDRATDPVAAPAVPEIPAPVGSGVAGSAAIAIRGLTKRYPGGVLALDRLELDVPTGSVFGLLGPNGAGKTTTLRILAGLAHPSAGTATVAGAALGTDALRSRIGFLDQDPRYYGWATGSELVMFVGLLHGMSGSALEAPDRRGPRPGRPDRGGRPAGRDLLGRDASAPGHRPGAREPAGRPHPRRAGELARPGGPARPPGAHRRPARDRDGALLDPRPGRRRARLRPGRDPRPRAPRDRGAARLAPRPVRAADLPDPAGAGPGRGGRRTGRARSGPPTGRPTCAVDHGIVRVTVRDPGRASRRAAAGDRRRRASRCRASSGSGPPSRTSSSSSPATGDRHGGAVA